jgi:hypothetical protein
MSIKDIYWLLKTIEDNYVPTVVRSFTNLLVNQTFDYNMEGAYKYPLSLYLFYGFFCSSAHLIHVAAKSSLVGLTDPTAYIAPVVLGAVLQGRPDCPSQIKIEQCPLIAAMVGGINGLLCCLGYSLLQKYAPVDPAHTPLLAAIVFVPAMSKAMCNIEGNILNLYQYVTAADADVTKEGGCCCH